MIPYGKQSLDEGDIEEVIKVLRSDFITQGPRIPEFERALAEYCGAKYAVAAFNGTAALHLAYLASGLEGGDEVITTPNTFASTSNMLLAVGAKPVFGDIRNDTYNIDESKIEALITPKTRAIVPVHFAGQPCAMREIWETAEKHGLLVIEDASHALGVDYEGKKIGGGGSDMVIFSFHPVKSMTTGEGGAVLTNNEKFYEKMNLLRSHGIYKDEQGKNVMIELGYNYRMTDIQAALGISQLKKLDGFIEKRRRVAHWYKQALAGIEEIILPLEAEGLKSGWHIYIVRTKKAEDRDGLMKFLKQKDIGVNYHYPAVYRHPYYRKIGYSSVSLPNEEAYQNSCLTLPIYPDLSEKDVKYISDSIKEFFER